MFKKESVEGERHMLFRRDMFDAPLVTLDLSSPLCLNAGPCPLHTNGPHVHNPLYKTLTNTAPCTRPLRTQTYIKPSPIQTLTQDPNIHNSLHTTLTYYNSYTRPSRITSLTHDPHIHSPLHTTLTYTNPYTRPLCTPCGVVIRKAHG